MNRKGFTLIEVIISILIFGVIVLLISYAVSQGLYQYKGVIHKTANFWEKSKILLLHKSFASTLDYYVKEEEWFPLFEGDSNSIVYITESPIADNLPVLAIITNEIRDFGQKTLVYYELPINTLKYKEIIEIHNSGKLKEGKRIVLIENLDSVSFDYFGRNINKESSNFYSNFSGKKQKILPQFVKISLKQYGKKIDFIFVIKNNSYIKEIYNDIY